MCRASLGRRRDARVPAGGDRAGVAGEVDAAQSKTFIADHAGFEAFPSMYDGIDEVALLGHSLQNDVRTRHRHERSSGAIEQNADMAAGLQVVDARSGLVPLRLRHDYAVSSALSAG